MNALKIAGLLLLVVIATASSAQVQLEVTVTNLRKQEGSIRVGLFRNSQDFLKRPVYGKVAPAAGDSVTLHFSGVKRGVYGISVIHDINGNGKLDTNIIGIPKEGFAFGNNAVGMLGPPMFDKASVKIGDSKITQILELKHF